MRVSVLNKFSPYKNIGDIVAAVGVREFRRARTWLMHVATIRYQQARSSDVVNVLSEQAARKSGASKLPLFHINFAVVV